MLVSSYSFNTAKYNYQWCQKEQRNLRYSVLYMNRETSIASMAIVYQMWYGCYNLKTPRLTLWPIHYTAAFIFQFMTRMNLMLTFYEYNCEKDPVPTYYEYYRENEADANLPWIWPWEWSRCLQLLRKAPGSWCWSWTACGCQSPNMYWNQHNNGCHRQLFFCNQITYHQVNSKDPGQFSWTIRSSELGDGLLNS